MSDMIKRDDVLRIIEGRFSGLMIGDILKQDINDLPATEDIKLAPKGKQCKIDRCELFNRLATITAEDANEMKAKIYAVIQEMPALPERVIQPVHVHIDTEEILKRIREEYELTDDIVPSADRPQGEWKLSDFQFKADNDNDNYSYVCTNCNHTDIHAKTQKVPYCWWCGARMKGADDD